MTVHWLLPLAWWGLCLLALPIAIHLLARQRSQRRLFPSLRFLPVEQMAALRRRVLTNWLLLIVRLLILAAAVAAFASPVFVSDARRQSWDQRVTRAVVVAPPFTEETRDIAADEARASYRSAEFSAVTLADAVGDARRWFETQPPAAREIVVVGDLREGAVTEHDFATVPPHVGLRFLPVAGRDERLPADWRIVAESADGMLSAGRAAVTPEPSRTLVEYQATPDPLPAAIRIAAAPADQAYAEALLRAVLREGLVLGTDGDRAVTIAFDGATLPGQDRLATPTHEWMRATLAHVPDVRGGELDGGLVVQPRVALRDARSPRVVADVVRAAFTDTSGQRAMLEPRRIFASTLTAWSRPHGAAADVRPTDEGDRRWFWGAVLVLLALEHVMRKRHRAA